MYKENHILLSTELLQTITQEQAWFYQIIPKSVSVSSVEFFINENQNYNNTVDELEILFGKKVKLEKTPKETIHHTLGKYYRKSDRQTRSRSVNQISSKSDNFLEDLIVEANSIDCSDIHIEAYENQCRVRMRIDGKLVERYIINKDDYPSLINKIKINSNLDIAEKRLPQDGRILFSSQKVKFDIRVSVLPTLHGEKIVLRLLSKDSTSIEISELGLNHKQMNDYLEAIQKPHGIILISGPTGSGKTTTLYATLKILNMENTNLLTIEDPIEYTLDGINQVQLKESIGLNFASALRTFLRQDPDVIMLGEIRDTETAQMAIRAALTGHLVLSTIHTNSAWGTVSRLIDMGIPPFLLANTLNSTVSQRLVRLLCPACKIEQKIDKAILSKLKLSHLSLSKQFITNGCEKCYYTGYKGRKAIFEVIPVDSDLSIKIRNSNYEINDLLQSKGIQQMHDSAISIFEKGLTTIEEIYPMILSRTQ